MEHVNRLFSIAQPQESNIKGACVDTGAQRSVIGVHQAKAYCNELNYPFNPKKGGRKHRFKFGNTIFTGLGLIEIRIPLNEDSYLSYDVEVVDFDVPLLLGLDILDAFTMALTLLEGDWLGSTQNGEFR